MLRARARKGPFALGSFACRCCSPSTKDHRSPGTRTIWMLSGATSWLMGGGRGWNIFGGATLHFHSGYRITLTFFGKPTGAQLFLTGQVEARFFTWIWHSYKVGRQPGATRFLSEHVRARKVVFHSYGDSVVIFVKLTARLLLFGQNSSSSPHIIK